MYATMERPTDIRFELNHSCTSQCPNPCPYTSAIERDDMDVVVSPDMVSTNS